MKVQSPKSTARTLQVPAPPLMLEPLRAGMRLAVAVSGGADSVALLRGLVQANSRAVSGVGLGLSVAHMHHGIRGEEADADASFVESLAAGLGLRCHRSDVDTPEVARAEGVGLEEAARSLRYRWFAELLSSGAIDAVATAHTLDDQAETVLHKLVRGAWTEGLSGIYPEVKPGTQGSAGQRLAQGLLLRPLLGATRAQVVSWLQFIGETWREDSTNADLQFTRNRIRHRLLPELATYNPRIAHQLAHMATIAREEDAYWQKEVERLLPGLLLPGRAVRGGGRASSTLPGERSLAIELERLRGLHPALKRRLLRGAARELGVALDFEETARLMAMVEAVGESTSRREELTGELRAERTPRELRLLFAARSSKVSPAMVPVEIEVPGEGVGFGWRLRCSLAGDEAAAVEKAHLRAAEPGDRVQLRYSRGAPKRIKEVLERMGVPAPDRAGWPLLEWQGEIVWLAGAVLEKTSLSARIVVEGERLDEYGLPVMPRK